jgi:hypothetical protein
MTLSPHDSPHNRVDRKFRAKVMIIVAISCLGFWGAVGFFALRSL